MAQGRGNARAILFAAAMLAVVQAVAAKDIIVGGSNKWDYPPGTDTTYYDTWAASTTFNVGDNLGKWILFILRLQLRNSRFHRWLGECGICESYKGGRKGNLQRGRWTAKREMKSHPVNHQPCVY